jgi:hypothetical protein
VPGGQQPVHDRVALDVGGVGGQQLLELVEQEAEDTGLGGVQAGDDVLAPAPERPHESRW